MIFFSRYPAELIRWAFLFQWRMAQWLLFPCPLSFSLSPSALFYFFSFLTFRPNSPRYIALILVWNGIIDYRRNIARTYQLTTCRRNRRTSHGIRQADPNELFVSSFAVIFIHRAANEPALPFLSSFYSFMSQSYIG